MDEPTRILCITAHPDDVDFGAAGTVATWTRAGAEVSYCIVTDGDAGGFDPDVPRDQIAGIRRREQEAAARVLGVTDVTFLGYPDGALEVSIDLRRDLSREIRRLRPHRVVCQSPHRSWRSVYRSHPDHMAAGEAALCAVYPDARNPFAHEALRSEEGLEAWTVPEVWVMAAEEDRHAELEVMDVTDVFELKLRALRCHASQLPEPEDLPDRMRDWGRRVAVEHGLADDRLAEAFTRVPTA